VTREKEKKKNLKLMKEEQLKELEVNTYVEEPIDVESQTSLLRRKARTRLKVVRSASVGEPKTLNKVE
jgi:hypothetical protein